MGYEYSLYGGGSSHSFIDLRKRMKSLSLLRWGHQKKEKPWFNNLHNTRTSQKE